MLQNSPKPLEEDEGTFMQHFVYSDSKTVTVSTWCLVIMTLNKAYEYIKETGLSKPGTITKHCYLGKHLIHGGEWYHIVTVPPKQKRVGHLTEYLQQGGFIAYWHDEMSSLAYSERVQDRSKVISRTKIKYDFGQNLDSIQIEGKVLTVFFLWGVCVGISIVVFIIEKLRSSFNCKNRKWKPY